MASKYLRRGLIATGFIVLPAVAATAFLFFSMDQAGTHTTHDEPAIVSEATRIGGIILPHSTAIAQATMTEDPQGGKDLSIVAKIPTQDTDLFVRDSKIQPWITGTIEPNSSSDCILITDNWPGYAITNRNGGKCLTDHGSDGYTQRDLALQPQNDGTTLIFMKLSNP